MDELTKYGRIEKYLLDEMSGAERKDFEAILKTDAPLREEVELHRKVAETLRGEKIHDFRKTLQNVDNQWERPIGKQSGGKVFRINWRRVLAVAASLALLVLAWQFFMVGSADDPFLAHHEPYQMVLNQRSAADGVPDSDLLNTAIQQYSTGQFAEAANAFEQLYKNAPENIAYQFYQAAALLSAENTATAIPIFENILTKPDHLFLEQSRWYLGLAYLKNNEREKAAAIFKKIKEGEFKHEEKERVLREME